MTMNEKTVNELWLENNLQLEKGKINLIVAPAGSGKTYWIFNTLINGYNPSRIIYLCDTSNLKEAVAKDHEYFDKCHVVGELYTGFNEKLTVMTYSAYGHALLKDSKAFDGIELVICDEAHNLYNYRNRFDGKNTKKGIDKKFVYSKTLDNLFEKVKSNKSDVVFITATHRRILEGMSYKEEVKIYHDDGTMTVEELYKVDTAHSRLRHTINFNKYPDVKRLYEKWTYKFCNFKNIIYHLTAYNGFKYGKKCLIYTDKIDTVKKLEIICENIGLRAVGIWSKHNEDKPMDKNQKEVRKSIIEKGLIPKDIDILIINSAYETGINIKDKNIELVVVNSLDTDTQIQSRSRVRKNIDALILRSSGSEEEAVVRIDDKWLNRDLTKEEKDRLCKEYPFYNQNSRLMKWTDFKKILENSGYKVGSRKITRRKVTIYTITEDSEKELIKKARASEKKYLLEVFGK